MSSKPSESIPSWWLIVNMDETPMAFDLPSNTAIKQLELCKINRLISKN